MAGLRYMPPKLTGAAPRLGQAPKRAEPFYQSKEWLALRVRRMKDADYAQAKARARDGERLILDHIVERRDGGAPLDPKNTQWLTMAEHQAKTARSKRGRVGGG